MSFQMRMMRSRASREPNETISFRRNWTLVMRKKISVPKNTTNWPIAGVTARTTVPTISAGLVSTETVCPPEPPGMIAALMSCRTASG